MFNNLHRKPAFTLNTCRAHRHFYEIRIRPMGSFSDTKT